MKTKRQFALAVIATVAMALSLVGCGVKVTNISVPDAATLEEKWGRFLN